MNTTLREKQTEKVLERTLRKVLRSFFAPRKIGRRDGFAELLEKGGGFDFLADEPNLYTLSDVCKKAR